MATTINTQLSDVVFLSEIRTLAFASTNPNARIEIKRGEDSLFDVTYSTPPDGVIAVEDVDEMLAPYLDDDTYIDIAIYADGILVSPSPLRVFCAHLVDVDMSAQSFLANCFMTATQEERETAPGLTEYLSVYDNVVGGVTVNATCRYYSLSTNNVLTETSQIASVLGLATINVSPVRFVDESKGLLIGYDITCNGRKMSYRVNNDMRKATMSVQFRNCFGRDETFHFFGMRTRTNKLTRSTALMRGNAFTYSVTEEPTFTIRTGYMRRGYEAVALDLARCKTASLLNSNGDSAEPLIISDVTCKFEEADDSITDMEFTMRRAPSRGLIRTPRPATSIFDTTFDQTYE